MKDEACKSEDRPSAAFETHGLGQALNSELVLISRESTRGGGTGLEVLPEDPP